MPQQKPLKDFKIQLQSKEQRFSKIIIEKFASRKECVEY